MCFKFILLLYWAVTLRVRGRCIGRNVLKFHKNHQTSVFMTFGTVATIRIIKVLFPLPQKWQRQHRYYRQTRWNVVNLPSGQERDNQSARVPQGGGPILGSPEFCDAERNLQVVWYGLIILLFWGQKFGWCNNVWRKKVETIDSLVTKAEAISLERWWKKSKIFKVMGSDHTMSGTINTQCRHDTTDFFTYLTGKDHFSLKDTLVSSLKLVWDDHHQRKNLTKKILKFKAVPAVVASKQVQRNSQTAQIVLSGMFGLLGYFGFAEDHITCERFLIEKKRGIFGDIHCLAALRSMESWVQSPKPAKPVLGTESATWVWAAIETVKHHQKPQGFETTLKWNEGFAFQLSDL